MTDLITYLDYESICPFCFQEYPAGMIEAEVPICIECNAEGRAIFVKPRHEVLTQPGLENLLSLRDSWSRNHTISPILRQTILQRLENLIRLAKE
jgi:hypothetical protein